MSEKDAERICSFQQKNSLLKVQIFESLIIEIKVGFCLGFGDMLKIEQTN